MSVVVLRRIRLCECTVQMMMRLMFNHRAGAELLCLCRMATAKELALTTDRWLFKVEPEPRFEDGQDVSLSVEALAALPNGVTPWDGVRNPQASGFMRDRMRAGHLGLMYYSNTKVPGIVATLKVVREGYPDHTAADYDPESSKPARWNMVDVQLQDQLAHYVPLWLLRLLADPSQLSQEQRRGLSYLTDEQLASIGHMPLVQPGRLSVQPVPPVAYETVLLLGAKGGFDSSHWPVPGQPAKRPKRQPSAPPASSSAKRPASPAADMARPAAKRKARPAAPAAVEALSRADGATPRRSARVAKKGW